MAKNKYFTLKMVDGRKGTTYTDWEGFGEPDKLLAAIEKKSGGLYHSLTPEGKALVMHYAFEVLNNCSMADVRAVNWTSVIDFALYVFGYGDDPKHTWKPGDKGQAYAYIEPVE